MKFSRTESKPIWVSYACTTSSVPYGTLAKRAMDATSTRTNDFILIREDKNHRSWCRRTKPNIHACPHIKGLKFRCTFSFRQPRKIRRDCHRDDMGSNLKRTRTASQWHLCNRSDWATVSPVTASRLQYRSSWHYCVAATACCG